MKKTKLSRLSMKSWSSKGVAVLICFVAFMFVGLTTTSAQFNATLDTDNGLITLDELQPFPTNGIYTFDVSELGLQSAQEAETYFLSYEANGNGLFDIETNLTTEVATLTINYQLIADVALPVADWNARLDFANERSDD